MFFGRFLIIINCIIYIAIAVWAIVSPKSLFTSIDVVALSRAGVIEMQVLIAGSMIAFSLIIRDGIFNSKQTKSALIKLSLINSAWLATRMVVLFDDLSDSKYTYVYLAFELAMLIFIFTCLQIIKSDPGRTLFSQDEQKL